MVQNLWILDSNSSANSGDRHGIHFSILREVAFLGLEKICLGDGGHFPEVSDEWETWGTREFGARSDEEDGATVFVDGIEDECKKEFSSVGGLGDEGEEF